MQGFDGMTAQPIPLDELLAAREELITTTAGGMPDGHKDFLRGFKRGQPDWSLLGVPGATDLPAVRWKQLNLGKLTAEARARLIDQLEERLEHFAFRLIYIQRLRGSFRIRRI